MAEQGKREDAGPAAARWLERMLEQGLRIPEGLPAAERARRLRAAWLAVAELAPEGATLSQRILAVHAVIAHGAAMDWMARSNAPDLPDKARHAALNTAINYMNLYNRQTRALSAFGRVLRQAKKAGVGLGAAPSKPSGTATMTRPSAGAKPDGAAPTKVTARRRKDGSWLH